MTIAARWIVCVPAGILAMLVTGFLVRLFVWFAVGHGDPIVSADLIADVLTPVVSVFVVVGVAPHARIGAALGASAVVLIHAALIWQAVDARAWWLTARLMLAPAIALGCAWAQWRVLEPPPAS